MGIGGLLFFVQFVKIPTDRVFMDIFDMLVIVIAVSYDMVMKTGLPDVFAIFLVAKAFKRGHKL